MVNDCSKQTSPLSRIFLMCECVTFYVLRDSDLGSLYSCYVSCILFISFYKNAPTSQVVVDFSEFELAVSVNNSRAQVKVSQHTDMLVQKILLVHLWSGEVCSCCTSSLSLLPQLAYNILTTMYYCITLGPRTHQHM